MPSELATCRIWAMRFPRKRLNNGAAMALAGITEIRRKRAEISGNPDKPSVARAYILHQLKHPDEVNVLRRVYGASFYLVAGHAPRSQRVKDLGERWAREESQPGRGLLFESKAIDVITADEKQDDDLGAKYARCISSGRPSSRTWAFRMEKIRYSVLWTCFSVTLSILLNQMNTRCTRPQRLRLDRQTIIGRLAPPSLT